MLSSLQTEVFEGILIPSHLNPVKDETVATNHFEFWPAWTVHLPMYLLGIYWGVRLRNLNFFAAVNPSMENGGLFNYSKFDSMKDFPRENIPISILSQIPHRLDSLLQKALEEGITFPFILKPNIGERGRGVQKIADYSAAAVYLETFKSESVILQEFISKSEEYGVFIIKNPKTGELKIPSITQKIPLQVKGDGEKNVAELIQKHSRANRYQKEVSFNLLNIIPAKNELFKLSHKGNHCKGAMFLDRSSLITDEVIGAFEKICQPFQDFYYGRLDVKVNTGEDLGNPALIKILEVNGANSEPIHIYSPGKNYFKSLGVIREYFAEMASIAKYNLQYTNPKIKDLWSSFQIYRHLKNYKYE